MDITPSPAVKQKEKASAETSRMNHFFKRNKMQYNVTK